MGWNDPTGSLWPRIMGQKWGRSSPAPVLPAPKFFVVHSTTFMLFNTFVHPQGERNRERRGHLCLPCPCHPAQQALPVNHDLHLPDKCQKRWRARASAVRFWSAIHAHQPHPGAKIDRGSLFHCPGSAPARLSEIRDPRSPGLCIRAFPTSCESRNISGFRSTNRPLAAV
jgi:hypothetical protein